MRATLEAAELRSLVSEAALHAGKDPSRKAITLKVLDEGHLHVSASDTWRSFFGRATVEDAEAGAVHLAPDLLSSMVRTLKGPVTLEVMGDARFRVAELSGAVMYVPQVVDIDDADEVEWKGYEQVNAEALASAARSLLSVDFPPQWPGAQVFDDASRLRLMAAETGASCTVWLTTGEGNRSPLPASLIPSDMLKRMAALQASEEPAYLRWCREWWGVAHDGRTWAYRSHNNVFPEGYPGVIDQYVGLATPVCTVDSARLKLAVQRAGAQSAGEHGASALHLQDLGGDSLSVTAGRGAQRAEDRVPVEPLDAAAPLDETYGITRLAKVLAVLDGDVELSVVQQGEHATLLVMPDPSEIFLIQKVRL